MPHYFKLTRGIEVFYFFVVYPASPGNEQMKSTIVTIIYS
jgi:hypothetical protein